MIKFIVTIIINIFLTLGLFYIFIFSKVDLIEEWVHLKKNIIKEKSKIILSQNSQLEGNIEINMWEIILKENSKLIWDIILNAGNIILEKNTEIIWNIFFNGEIILWENAIITWNISKESDLKKHSTSKISWEKPNLFVTTDYPEFLKYFDVLPEKHKLAFWYIFLTSSNMDIRWKDLKPEQYFQKIFVYKNNTLTEINKSENSELLAKLYKKSSEYINILPERKVGRFWVGFVTKNYAQDKNFADMYLSSSAAEWLLFMHETGHILDYKYSYIDYHNPDYPYPDTESAITEYGKFHKWEDFAEAYRYYVLHHDSFQRKSQENPILQKKYDYLKQYVFNGKEYN